MWLILEVLQYVFWYFNSWHFVFMYSFHPLDVTGFRGAYIYMCNLLFIAYLYVYDIFLRSDIYVLHIIKSSGCTSGRSSINTLRPGQNGCHFCRRQFQMYFFLNENVWIMIQISRKFVPKGPINNIPALVQIVVWRRPGNKPLFEPVMVSLLTHICVTQPQWVNICIGDIIKGPFCC